MVIDGQVRPEPTPPHPRLGGLPASSGPRRCRSGTTSTFKGHFLSPRNSDRMSAPPISSEVPAALLLTRRLPFGPSPGQLSPGSLIVRFRYHGSTIVAVEPPPR